MAKRKMAVRVVLTDQQDDQWGTLIEQLRYAGLLDRHDNVGTGNSKCFDLLPPHGVDGDVWAEQNAQRMQSFGINAVAAPAWNQ